jgi:hypothetical protein
MKTIRQEEDARAVNFWLSFFKNFNSFIFAVSMLIVGWILSPYHAFKYPGDFTSPLARFYRWGVMIIAIAVGVYLGIGVARFLGVALMRDPGIKPEAFLDWWWIRLIHLLAGK